MTCKELSQTDTEFFLEMLSAGLFYVFPKESSRENNPIAFYNKFYDPMESEELKSKDHILYTRLKRWGFKF